MATNPNFLVIALRADRNQKVHYKFFNINTEEHPDLDLTNLEVVCEFVNEFEQGKYHYPQVIVVQDSNGEGGPRPALSITYG